MSEELGQIVVLFIASMGFGVLVAFSRVEAGRIAMAGAGHIGLACLFLLDISQVFWLLLHQSWLPLFTEPHLYALTVSLAMFGGFGLGGWLMLRPVR
jgi:hypothetical protein